MKLKNLLVISLFFALTVISCKKENNENTTDDVKETSEASQTTETTDNSEVKFEMSVPQMGVFTIDNNTSKVSWKGSKPAGTHYGEIVVKSGEMNFEDGNLISGSFIADMSTINVMDLEGDEKSELENHLKGNIEGKEDHFFNVNTYPESKFVIKSITPENDSYKITGDLTIKDKTNTVELNSKIMSDVSKNIVRLETEEFAIDRTKWGIEFMSKSVFDDLKDKFIDDEIKLKVELQADKVL